MMDAVNAVAYSDQPSTPVDKPSPAEEGEAAAPPEPAVQEAAEGETAEEEEAAAADGGFWGSITSIADGIKTAVDEQIAVQAAALEVEQAKISAERKPAESEGLPWATASEAIQGQILALSEVTLSPMTVSLCSVPVVTEERFTLLPPRPCRTNDPSGKTPLPKQYLSLICTQTQPKRWRPANGTTAFSK